MIYFQVRDPALLLKCSGPGGCGSAVVSKAQHDLWHANLADILDALGGPQALAAAAQAASLDVAVQGMADGWVRLAADDSQDAGEARLTPDRSSGANTATPE